MLPSVAATVACLLSSCGPRACLASAGDVTSSDGHWGGGGEIMIVVCVSEGGSDVIQT